MLFVLLAYILSTVEFEMLLIDSMKPCNHRDTKEESVIITKGDRTTETEQGILFRTQGPSLSIFIENPASSSDYCLWNDVTLYQDKSIQRHSVISEVWEGLLLLSHVVYERSKHIKLPMDTKSSLSTSRYTEQKKQTTVFHLRPLALFLPEGCLFNRH